RGPRPSSRPAASAAGFIHSAQARALRQSPAPEERLTSQLATRTLMYQSWSSYSAGRVGALLFAAVGVVVQLKDALNTVWGVEFKQDGAWQFIRTYVVSLAGVLSLGFLLLVRCWSAQFSRQGVSSWRHTYQKSYFKW